MERRIGLARRLIVVCALLVALSAVTLVPVGAQPPGDIVAGEILVKFKPGTPGQVAADVHRQGGGQLKEEIPGIGVQVVSVPVGQELARVAAYARNGNVLFAEPNGISYIEASTNDPKVGQQWQYNNTGQSGGTVDADIDAFEAWNVTMGSDTVAIAILDTGIDQSHEDLKVKIKKNVNFSGTSSVDDKLGHGTHVAGTAAAATNNGRGVAGTCPNCVLYNVKVGNDQGAVNWDAAAKGIQWAADNGARVVNMSFSADVGSSTLAQAVDYAWGKGVVLVAAAGNQNTDTLRYPAAYGSVIAVAATDRKDARWVTSSTQGSNYGASWVDVAAPGHEILSTAPDHINGIWFFGVKYGTLSGTSMASPHVAGVAGLIWSSGVCNAAPDPKACVRERIESKADAITGTGTDWAWGRVNANSSVAP